MLKYNIITLGCKVNSYETDSLKEILESNNYQHAENDLDLVIINTCSVTHVSEAKSRQKIRRAINDNPQSIIVVLGCYAQIASNEIEKIPGVNIIIGTSNRHKIIEYIKDFKNGKSQLNKVELLGNNPVFDNKLSVSISDRTRAFIKVQDGCNNYCSYCIIPYTRGNVRSRNKEEIIQEIKRLVNGGYKEIVLTGIHTGGYGKDFDNYDLTMLLKDILRETDIMQIRISSIEMTEIDDRMIELIASEHRIARHLHIPLQSGSNEILKRMNRKYTKEEFISKMHLIKSKISDLTITTDIIIGFPGETEVDFQDSVNVSNICEFLKIHVFEYSIRSGTPAATFKNQIDPKIKKVRSNELLLISNDNQEKVMNQFLNKVVTVLIEEKRDNYLIGHTSNYLKVKIISENEKIINEMVEVKLIKNEKDYLLGIIN